MELYRTRYDGSDAVAVYIQQVLQLVESEKLRITLHGDKNGKLERCLTMLVWQTSLAHTRILLLLDATDLVSTKTTKNWSDIFIRHPRFYLRISLTLDLAISRGQYPRESDLPPLVRELPMKGQRRSATDMLLEDSPTEEAPAALESTSTNLLQQRQQQQQQHVDEAGSNQPHNLQQFIPQQAPQQTDLWLQSTGATATDEDFGSVPPSANREHFSDPASQALFTQSPSCQDDEPLFQPPQQPMQEQAQAQAQPNLPLVHHQQQHQQQQRPPLDEVNLDFLDLRNPHDAGGSDVGVDEYAVGSQPADPAAAIEGEPNWSGSILDEILNAISA